MWGRDGGEGVGVEEGGEGEGKEWGRGVGERGGRRGRGRGKVGLEGGGVHSNTTVELLNTLGHSLLPFVETSSSWRSVYTDTINLDHCNLGFITIV